MKDSKRTDGGLKLLSISLALAIATNFSFFNSARVFADDGQVAQADDLYFPPVQGDWKTADPVSVGWNKRKLGTALNYARSQQSTSVVVLHRGKILAEQHWELNGEDSEKFKTMVIGSDSAGHNIEDVASAQKSVTSFLVGIAQQKGLLKLDDPVSQYLGDGWSRATADQEKAIKIQHLITMTSGLNDRGRYEAKPGTKWHYNTPAYAKSMEVVAAAAKMDRHELTAKWLTQPIGMNDSKWSSRGELGRAAGNSYGFATTARDLARFGLLVMAKGKWENQVILSDKQYLESSTKTSQKLNPYYGYLWWVSRNANESNGKTRPITAPEDMFTAKGRLTRRCYVVPSLQLVVTRLGDQPADGKSFDLRFWKLLMEAAPKETVNKN